LSQPILAQGEQAQIYKSVLEACLESQVCKSFTFWVVGDKYSFLEKPEFANVKGASLDADPTMFDDELNPKPAYFAIRDMLMRK
jgi:endo-1,4-beta-xylanase